MKSIFLKIIGAVVIAFLVLYLLIPVFFSAIGFAFWSFLKVLIGLMLMITPVAMILVVIGSFALFIWIFKKLMK